MTRQKVRRRRLGVLAFVLLSVVAFAAYAALIRTPGDVDRAAISAVRSNNPGQDDGQWSVTCDKRGERAHDCVVSWKQVGISPADAPGSFCEDFAVQVRDAQVATTPVRLENDARVSLLRC